jgi:hypothetical protein
MYFRNFAPTLAFFDQIENCLSLALVYRSSSAVVIIPDNHNVEDVAGDSRRGPPRCPRFPPYLTVPHRGRDFEDGIGASARRNARASEVKYTCSAEIRA